MAKTLELHFLNEEGKIVKIMIDSPKEPVVPGDVALAMDEILASNAFFSAGGNFISKKGGRIVERNVADLTF